MTMLRACFEGGVARRQGRPAADNPYRDFERAAAWAYGWHKEDGSLNGAIERQARRAGLFRRERRVVVAVLP